LHRWRPMILDTAAIGASVIGAIAKRKVSSFPEEAVAYATRSKLEALLGSEIWAELAGREVLDFGCGPGIEAVEMAEHGAARVIGVDIREKWLRQARARAEQAGVADRCEFHSVWREPVDLIVCVDCFEHFADPPAILAQMRQLLRPGGKVLVSFGPPWRHPLGGHVYSVFPFAHLIFPEPSLVQWRSTFRADGARTIEESGINKMTVKRFERLVAMSPLEFECFEAVPISRLRPFAVRFTREFTTSVIRGRLVPRREETPGPSRG
jgi:SAM-dependent methyltransferase